MDEKGFMKGIGDNVKVLVPVTEEEVFSIQPGNKEWVSAIECIGTNGYTNPTPILQKYRPKTPPFASLTNEDGVRIDIQLQPDQAAQVNKIMAQLLEECTTPDRLNSGSLETRL